MGATEVAETGVAASKSASSSGQERRIASRFACEGRAEVVVLGGALRFTGKLCNLSLTGCRLIPDQKFTLERGTLVEIVMVVDNTHFRIASGVRSNSRTRGLGLEFTAVPARSVQYLHSLIAELEAKPR